MRYTGRKGWEASMKDTWCLKTALSPMIGAAIVKYKEAITSSHKCGKGLSQSWMEFCVEEGFVVWEDKDKVYLSDESFNICFNKYLDMVDECIYAFTEKEPDILDYDFTFNSISGEPDVITFPLVCTNEEEKERYSRDSIAHNARVQKGSELFGKYLSTFWW